MPEPFRTQRLRDPVHGLITFRAGDPLDELAWRLINTPELQRLRRIKQLGVSELVFPGATHTRFAHCIGVFHVARQLLTVIRREIGEPAYDRRRAQVAVIAALLHDIGHGPFSHTFESVQANLGSHKHHEAWTAEIIRNPEGQIRPLLDGHWSEGGFCDAVADLLAAEDPTDIYHAIVSSSFDADRLDYLRRDRLMTGTGAGAIDFDWLLEHIRVKEVSLEAGDESEEGVPGAQTFCLHIKALPAAEQFLLARHTLYEQVYFHKTTRCVEAMVGLLLRQLRHCCQQETGEVHHLTGLDITHPLVRFFRGEHEILGVYLALDDVVVMGAIEQMARAGDTRLADLARRLRDRDLFKALDIGIFGADEGRRRSRKRAIDRHYQDQLGISVIVDTGASLSIYTEIGGEEEKTHKKLRILDSDGSTREITKLSDLVRALGTKRLLTRYFFERAEDREAAKNVKGAPR